MRIQSPTRRSHKLTGIGCWALCAASDTDEYDDEEIKYDQNDDNKFN